MFGYEPPIPGTASPYREIGAVFAHAGECAAPAIVDTYPEDWRGRPQVLRAYDARGWIHPATTTHDGTEPASELTRVLSEHGVAEVHSRNIAYGCFMFAATHRHVIEDGAEKVDEMSSNKRAASSPAPRGWSTARGEATRSACSASSTTSSS